MVKGISRQVIVVQGPEPKLFEQAIFILKDDAAKSGVTDEILLREAERVIQAKGKKDRYRRFYFYSAFWAGTGAFVMGLFWLAVSIF